MYKIHSFLFLLILSFQSYSQNLIEADLLKKCKENRLSSITNLIESYLRKKDVKREYFYYIKVHDELVDSYYQTSIVFSEHIFLTKEPGYTTTDYTINIIHKNDTAIFWNLFLNRTKPIERSQFGTVVADDNLLISKDSSKSEVQKLKDGYKAVYNYNLVTSKLFKSDDSFGYKCGFAYTKPKPRITLDQLVSNDADQVILNWLKSPNVVYQLYALDGLHTMQKSNYTLDEPTQEIIKNIYKKKGVVKVCLASDNYCTISAAALGELLNNYFGSIKKLSELEKNIQTLNRDYPSIKITKIEDKKEADYHNMMLFEIKADTQLFAQATTLKLYIIRDADEIICSILKTEVMDMEKSTKDPTPIPAGTLMVLNFSQDYPRFTEFERLYLELHLTPLMQDPIWSK